MAGQTLSLNGRPVVAQLQKARDIRDIRDTRDINQGSLVSLMSLMSLVSLAFLERLCDCASYAPVSIFSRKA